MIIALGVLLYITAMGLIIAGVHRFNKECEEKEKAAHLKAYFERRAKKNEPY